MTSCARLLRLVIVTLGLVLLAGCVASKIAEGRPGVNLSPIVPGATRAQVEDVLGTPAREWTTSLGVRYCLYRYDAGVAPNPELAAFLGAMDALMLGSVSASAATTGGDALGPSRRPLLGVSYGPDNRVRGVFKGITEFSPLPEDGRVPEDKR